MTPLGTSAPDFALPDVVSGKTVRRGDFDGRPLLVMFICNHCPYVKHVRAGLAKLTAEYVAKGVGVVAISSNDAAAYPADGPDAMKVEAKEAGKVRVVGCSTHLLYDRGHKLAYRGQMDASRPKQDVIPVTGKDLRAALDAVIGGRDPAAEQTPSKREQIQREIDATDRQIDQLVYQLYGLTDDEIRIVEEATA